MPIVLLLLLYALRKVNFKASYSVMRILVGVVKKAVRAGLTEIIKNIGSPQLDSERQRDSYKVPLPEERRIC
jgi:hypothetical protein